MSDPPAVQHCLYDRLTIRATWNIRIPALKITAVASC
jgi:hypothetical protein